MKKYLVENLLIDVWKIAGKMKLKKLSARKKSISPNMDTLEDFNDDEVCSNG